MKYILAKKITSALLIVSLLLFNVVANSSDDLFLKLKQGHDFIRVPDIEKPGLHESYIDPVFKTVITRITDPSQVSRVSRIRHYYSKANPFNADESLAVMFASNGSKWLYDAKKWEPIQKLILWSSEPEIQWHPTDPDKFYYMARMSQRKKPRGMFVYNVKTNSRTLLKDFSEYKWIRGKLEGNMDKEGRYYALIGTQGKLNEIFVYDVLNNTISKKEPVSKYVASDWVSVSPSGKYVVAMGKYRSRIYDIKMNLIHNLPKGTFGHGDLCLGEKGTEYLVFDGADYEIDSNRNINKVNLKTGRIEIVTRIGWRSTPHVSCRNLDKPGWALISTQGPDNRYPNHDFEIFWVKLDGSGEVRRVAHHRSQRKGSGYFAEQQAVTNRSGNKIIFASNWKNTEAVSDYLIDLTLSGKK
ncbi:MAG: hypothetical protein ACC657_01240 [Thiohalomonadales bacterium]